MVMGFDDNLLGSWEIYRKKNYRIMGEIMETKEADVAGWGILYRYCPKCGLMYYKDFMNCKCDIDENRDEVKT